MAIKKRTNVPPVTEATEQEDKGTSEARHPLLNGIRLNVYQFIQSNPGCTRDDVSRGTGIKSSTCTARIKELIDEGLVLDTRERKVNRNGVSARMLRVSSRPQGGVLADKVRVELTLTIDCNGVYGATARVVGSRKAQQGTPAPIKTQRITITAPPKAAVAHVFASAPVAVVSRMDTEQNLDMVIEGTAIEVTD